MDFLTDPRIRLSWPFCLSVFSCERERVLWLVNGGTISIALLVESVMALVIFTHTPHSATVVRVLRAYQLGAPMKKRYLSHSVRQLPAFACANKRLIFMALFLFPLSLSLLLVRAVATAISSHVLAIVIQAYDEGRLTNQRVGPCPF